MLKAYCRAPVGFKCLRFYQSSSRLVENKLVEVNHDVVDFSKPLVALESTIITHGMPYPKNVEMALQVESEIKSVGAQPVTIAFIDGRFKAGLTRQQIETLGKNKDRAIKISRRDLPFIFSNRSDRPLYGGTTVSATSLVANAVGIKVFCTGGIGGVHRDYLESMDVSADLYELARTEIAVVCSGVKSILDVGKTLEYLESLGVCVASLNPDGSTEFPAFFTRRSGFQAPFNCRSEVEAAELIRSNLSTGLGSGVLIAVPVPHEFACDDQRVEKAIREALDDAKRLNIRGKKVTPFLLEKINQLTQGRSLESNLALIKNNAKTSGKIAVALKHLETTGNQTDIQVTVVGGVNLDSCFNLTDETTLHLTGVTQPAKFSQTPGGVGGNMSEALVKLGVKGTKLITAVGNDLAGNYLIHKSREIGLDTSRIHVVHDPSFSTGTYCAVLGCQGDLKVAYGDMNVHGLISPQLVESNLDVIQKSQMVVLDANIPLETLKYICEQSEKENIPVWYNPTDYRKCDKIVQIDCLSKLTYMSPNYKELLLIVKSTVTKDARISSSDKNRLLKMCENLDEPEGDDHLKDVLKYLLEFVPFIVVSRGEKDLVLATRKQLNLKDSKQMPLKGNVNEKYNFHSVLYFFPTLKLSRDELKNVSGAGDCATAGIISGIIKGYSVIESVYNGLLAAKYSLQTNKCVSDLLVNIKKTDVNRFVEENEKNVKIIKL